MAEPYTTPFNVWQRLGREERRKKTVATLETGDIVDLEKHVVPDEVQVLDGSGNKVSDTDYSIDTKFNQLSYSGTASLSDVTINYFTAPVTHNRATRGVEQAESHINNHLNLAFGGERRRTKEIYQTDGGTATVIMFDRQPVKEVETVWFNKNPSDDVAPNWVELVEDEDYIQYQNTGIKLTTDVSAYNDASGFVYTDTDRNELSRNPKQVQATYTYGYDKVPGDIQNLAEILLATDMFIDTVFGAGVDGRDNFDPQTLNRYRNKVETIKGEWTRRFYDNFSTMVEKGEDSEVTQ